MSSKNFYTEAEHETAKNQNIVQFLQQTGYELVLHNNEYRGKIHDSLVIRDNGSWYWNSMHIGGNSPIELYKQILLHDFNYGEKEAYIEATKQLAEYSGSYGNSAAFSFSGNKKGTPHKTSVRPPGVPLRLPERNVNDDRAIQYLTKTRKLDGVIVDGLIRWGKIYEDTHHNAVFVAYDRNKVAQNAFLRGTLPDKPFKKDVELSDKSYPFTLCGYPSSNSAYVFESAVDCISHATIYKNNGLDWRGGHRISLGGVASGGLDRFLRENPQVNEVILALDNDDTGNKKCEKLAKELKEKYAVTREKSAYKDFNEDLVRSHEKNDSICEVAAGIDDGWEQ